MTFDAAQSPQSLLKQLHMNKHFSGAYQRTNRKPDPTHSQHNKNMRRRRMDCTTASGHMQSLYAQLSPVFGCLCQPLHCPTQSLHVNHSMQPTQTASALHMHFNKHECLLRCMSQKTHNSHANGNANSCSNGSSSNGAMLRI